MKLRNCILVITFFSALGLIHAQSKKDTLRYEKTFGNLKFYYKKQQLSWSQTSQQLESHKPAMAEFNSAKKNRTISIAFGTLGGFFLGFQLSNHLTGQKVNMGQIMAGGSLVGVSIFLDAKSKKRAKSAVDIYNANLSK